MYVRGGVASKESLVAVLCFLTSCSGSPRVGTTPTEDSEETVTTDRTTEATTTRYRVGDEIHYRYRGAGSEPQVDLIERIVRQEGNRLEIEVVARRGDEERRWVQVVTDTPENQQNNVLDELYEVVDGQRRRLANENNQDIIRLSSWIFAPLDGQTTPEGEETAEIEIAGRRYQCTRRTTQGASNSRPARMVTHRCPEFLWTHGPATLTDIESGEVLWETTVEAVSRDTQ